MTWYVTSTRRPSPFGAFVSSRTLSAVAALDNLHLCENLLRVLVGHGLGGPLGHDLDLGAFDAGHLDPAVRVDNLDVTGRRNRVRLRPLVLRLPFRVEAVDDDVAGGEGGGSGDNGRQAGGGGDRSGRRTWRACLLLDYTLGRPPRFERPANEMFASRQPPVASREPRAG